jgi:hypothetical protein
MDKKFSERDAFFEFDHLNEDGRIMYHDMGQWLVMTDGHRLFNKDEDGKWMLFGSSEDAMFSFVHYLFDMIKNNVIRIGKVDTLMVNGTTAFIIYVNSNDIESQKKVLKYLIEHDLIRCTKTGKLYNISFKFDRQTRLGEYGDKFNSEIKLSDFVDLNTGEFII